MLTKDLKLITTLGQETGTPLPLTDAALQFYRAAQSSALGSQDAAALIKLLREQAGQ